MEFKPFLADHLRYMQPQAGQSRDRAMMLHGELGDVTQRNFALSAWVDHRCIAAAGVVPIFAHRAVAWAILSDEAAPHMLAIVRKMRGGLDLLRYRRIEMTVSAYFEQGHRLARLMGMEPETPEPLRAHGAFGEDEMLYARIR